ncbi:BMP family ABC transporter substrate-binding protein [Hahella ganghwensis]|uniref:BMP family ABC transporter substrate-binding protein n=1 Tax=Hahella ganghwensis TaxID=286420 RepID=UPI00039D3FB2|nr:BMP family ABC transporter substrate-binding protein [Hahella ganghwensis]
MNYLKALLIAVLGWSSMVLAEPVKLAFLYPSPVGEAGWSYAHDKGRRYLEQYYSDKVLTDFADKVPTGRESRNVIQKYAELGFNIIFTASKDFAVQTSQAAKEFPKVQFVNIGDIASPPI